MEDQEILDGFFQIARTISESLDLDTILKKIGWAAEQVTKSEASSIMLLDNDKQNLFFKTASGEKGGLVKRLKIPVGSGIAGWVAREKQPIIVNDAQNDARVAKFVDANTGFITKSILCVPMIIGNELIGVAEVVNKKNGQFDKRDQELLENLANYAAVVISNAKFAEDQRNFFVNILEILANASESRDPRLSGHNWRIVQKSLAIARELNMDQKEYQNLYYAALLHDIGFLAPGDKALREKRHPELGSEMIRGITFLNGAAPIIRSHEEHYDGSGDPDGLVKEKIPLSARILGLIEYIEERAIEGESVHKVMEEIQAGAGTRFDPEVVKIYIEQNKAE